MPARLRIAASIAAPALAVPSAGGGAGDSRYQDPSLPVAIAGVVLVLGGLALRRRPHADR